MPLADEYKQALLLLQAAGLLKPYAGCTADEIRARMAPLEAMRKLAGPPVAAETDRLIPGPGGELAIRIYRPQGQAPFPMVVYFHGGGFVLGGIDSHAHICRELANRASALVVSVDYRRAPEHRFPAAVDDAYAAVCWVAEHAAAFDGDGRRLAVAGDSSGANLAAISALRCRDEGGPPLRFQLLVYPGVEARYLHPSRRENAQGYFLTEDAIEWFYTQYLRSDADRDHPWVSPLRAPDLHRLPPALVVTAEFDPLRDEGEAYALRLAQAGVASRARRYDGAIHAFFGGATAIGREALTEAASALQSALTTGAKQA